MNPERWKKIEQLYHVALARDTNQRAAFLEQACVGDDELRREVESLLAQEETTKGFLESPALEVAAEAMAKEQSELLVGQRIGFYQVLEQIGAGGMGEVYRAHDTKLARDVALKTLPKDFAADPERLARFRREARMLASLNHPNIAAIYGLEDSGNVHFLVMELVPGQTLAEQLTAGPFPVKEALRICGQIAEALEAAHEKGVIHRDLKPANVKLTPEGKPKVLDFGLAKAFGRDGPGSDPANAPTLTALPTEPGRIMGTPAYMSPEQARGKPVDKRTDIWAFGCLLYELLTGKPVFRAGTVSDTIAKVLEREPDWDALPHKTPARVRELLRRCLSKDAHLRLRDIGDAQMEIAEALAAPAPRKREPTRRQLVGLAAAAVVVAAGLVLAALYRGRTGLASAAQQASANTIASQLTNYGGSEAGAALSPDGRSFVFVSDHGGTPDIWLRQVSGGDLVRLTNDEAEEADLAYAPDGESIYYTRTDSNGTGIWEIGALGGQPRKVLEGARKPAPSPDGRSLAYVTSDAPGVTGNTFAIAVSGLNGGDVRTLARGIPQGYGPPRPSWSHDGRWLAYGAGALFGPAIVFVVNVETGQQRQVTQLPLGDTGIGQPAWLPDNRHLVVSYLPSWRQQAPADLGIVDVQSGSISRLTMTVVDGFIAPSVSADGSRLVATSIRHLSEVWKVPLGPDPDANGRAAVRLVDGSAAPMWSFVSRDGRTLLFNSPMSGSRNLWMMPVEGGVPPRQITAVPGDAISHSSLSPDGTHVAFASIVLGQSDIWTQKIDGTDLRRLTNDEPADSWPVWSPDGQWVAYLSFREGRAEAWRVRLIGGPPEKFLDGPGRGDWFLQPGGNGTWAARGGVELVDVERRVVLWKQSLRGTGLSLPMFSPDGRSISVPYQEARNHSAIQIFDVATGKSRLAVRLPFSVMFRADWVDDGRALVVNRWDAIQHIVMFDHFWTKESTQN